MRKLPTPLADTAKWLGKHWAGAEPSAGWCLSKPSGTASEDPQTTQTMTAPMAAPISPPMTIPRQYPSNSPFR